MLDAPGMLSQKVFALHPPKRLYVKQLSLGREN